MTGRRSERPPRLLRRVRSLLGFQDPATGPEAYRLPIRSQESCDDDSVIVCDEYIGLSQSPDAPPLDSEDVMKAFRTIHEWKPLPPTVQPGQRIGTVVFDRVSGTLVQVTTSL